MLKLSSYHSKILAELDKKCVNKHDRMVVVGAGLPRTGTLSLKAALTELLGAKCCHGMDHLCGDQEDLDMVIKATDGQMAPEDWKDYLIGKGCAAGVDTPVYYFYKDIMKAFPDCKVILSTRDPTSWYHSYKTLMEVGALYENSWSFNLAVNLLDRRKDKERLFMNKPSRCVSSYVPEGFGMSVPEAVEAGQEVAVKFFKDWEEDVKKNVPEDKLLVFRASDGWDPLCRFLGVKRPQTDYPRMNERESLERVVRDFQRIDKVLKSGLVAMVAGLVWWVVAEI